MVSAALTWWLPGHQGDLAGSLCTFQYLYVQRQTTSKSLFTVALKGWTSVGRKVFVSLFLLSPPHLPDVTVVGMLVLPVWRKLRQKNRELEASLSTLKSLFCLTLGLRF